MNPQLAAALAELTKMALQLGGALLIARLAVSWALDRYKAEKRWERETTALADLLGTIAQLLDVSEEWIAERARNDEDGEAASESRRQRYSESRRRLDTTLAAAAIVLPSAAQSIVEDLTTALDKRYDSWDEDLLETNGALGLARKKLVAFGRGRMGVNE